MAPCKGKALHGWPGRVFKLTLLLVCTSREGLSLAESPFPGQTFTYSWPPADIVALTTDRTNAPRNRNDKPIVVKGWTTDLSDPSFIFFSTGNDCQNTDVYPVIAAYDTGEWNTISFPGARNHYWSHVYLPSPYEDSEHMYAISSPYCGDPGGIYIYHSANGGQSWTVSSVRMHYLSRFLSLRMAPDGTGEIIVQSSNDPDPVGGHHVYRTTDWGETWSDPEFSETILSPPVLPGEYLTQARVNDIFRADLVAPSRYIPIKEIMDDIADQHAMHRQRQDLQITP
jgi:hypothetical protein